MMSARSTPSMAKPDQASTSAPSASSVFSSLYGPDASASSSGSYSTRTSPIVDGASTHARVRTRALSVEKARGAAAGGASASSMTTCALGWRRERWTTRRQRSSVTSATSAAPGGTPSAASPAAPKPYSASIFTRARSPRRIARAATSRPRGRAALSPRRTVQSSRSATHFSPSASERRTASTTSHGGRGTPPEAEVASVVLTTRPPASERTSRKLTSSTR